MFMIYLIVLLLQCQNDIYDTQEYELKYSWFDMTEVFYFCDEYGCLLENFHMI